MAPAFEGVTTTVSLLVLERFVAGDHWKVLPESAWMVNCTELPKQRLLACDGKTETLHWAETVWAVK